MTASYKSIFKDYPEEFVFKTHTESTYLGTNFIKAGLQYKTRDRPPLLPYSNFLTDNLCSRLPNIVLGGFQNVMRSFDVQ